MGIFDGIAEAGTSNRVSRRHLNQLGDFFVRVDNSKLISTSEGQFAIVEGEVIQLIGDEGNYALGDAVQHMQKHYDKTTLAGAMMKSYVAPWEGKEASDKLGDTEEENNAKWGELVQKAFGKPTMEGTELKFVAEEPIKGVVYHIKVVNDYQDGRKTKKLDDKGDPIVYKKVVNLGMVGPDDLSEETMARFGSTLAY